MKRKTWTDKEIEKLKKLYPTQTNKDISKLLNRTTSAVRTKAQKLGITGKTDHDGGKRWTEEHDAMIKKYYGKITAWKIGEKLDRTVPSIYRRAHRLGLKGKEKKKNPTIRRDDYYLWIKRKRKVFKRDNNKCVICGYSKHLNCHHILAVNDGGSDKLENLVTLCPNCHAEADAGEIKKHLLQYNPIC